MNQNEKQMPLRPVPNPLIQKQNPRIPNNPPPENKPYLPGDPEYVRKLMNEFRVKNGHRPK